MMRDDDPPRLEAATTGPSSSGSGGAGASSGSGRTRPTNAKIEAANAESSRPHFDGDDAERRPRSTRSSVPSSARGTASGLFLDLVRVPPSGTWERRRADIYALAEDWVGPEDATAEAGAGAPGSPLPHGLRPRTSRRDRRLGRVSKLDVRRSGARRARAAALRGRAGQGARRPPAAPAARCGHACAGPLPAGVGRDAPRPRAAHSDPPGEVPLTGLRHEDPPLREHVPRRRPGRRARGSYEKGKVKVEPFGRLPKGVRAELDDEAERLAEFHS